MKQKDPFVSFRYTKPSSSNSSMNPTRSLKRLSNPTPPSQLKTESSPAKRHRPKTTKSTTATKVTTTSEHCSSSMTILPAMFFQVDALDLAPRLLGKFLRRDNVVLRITEVEAYRPNDSACHGRFGVTARTAPVFGPGGHAYVYLCYGLHVMLNIVADKEGVGAAVLIRSCSPVSGLDTIQKRRGQKTDKPILLTGPGKIGQALGLTTEWSNHPLYYPGGLEVLDGPEPDKILIGPRVGIDYALPEHVNALWRFAIADTPWIFIVLEGNSVCILKPSSSVYPQSTWCFFSSWVMRMMEKDLVTVWKWVQKWLFVGNIRWTTSATSYMVPPNKILTQLHVSYL